MILREVFEKMQGLGPRGSTDGLASVEEYFDANNWHGIDLNPEPTHQRKLVGFVWWKG